MKKLGTAKAVIEYRLFDKIGNDFVERDLSGIKNSLCQQCDKCKKICSGMDIHYTGCIFYKAPIYAKQTIPGLGEYFYLHDKPDLPFEKNLEAGRKFSGNAEYRGRCSGDPDTMIFFKEEKR